MLSVSDVANLRLSADVVVLSACNTASGRRFAGEGSLSLARAFLYAGADRVLATRFQIDDEAAAALSTAFYQSMWRDGLMPSAALRQAQLALRRDPRWRSPFYWASFVLQGEP
jgi:CHAT domain-containing protein